MTGIDDARRMQEEAFWNSPLDSEEQEYEVAAENFVPCENQTELRQMLMEAARNAIEARKTKKRPDNQSGQRSDCLFQAVGGRNWNYLPELDKPVSRAVRKGKEASCF